MQMRNDKHIFLMNGTNFIIFRKSAWVIRPWKGALHNPSKGADSKPRHNLCGNIHIQAKFGFDICNECFSITLITTEFFDSWILCKSLFCRIYTRHGIVCIGGMNNNCKQISHRVGYNMSLAPFDLFAAVKASFIRSQSCFRALGVDERVTWSWLSSRTFAVFLTNKSNAASHLPDVTARRKNERTASCGGKSFGSKFHWQHVFTMYSTALTMSRFVCSARCCPLLLLKIGSIMSHCLSVRSVLYPICSPRGFIMRHICYFFKFYWPRSLSL